MQMTNSEILRDYNLAKDKRAQVGVLAELNATDKNTIIDILIEMGVNEKDLPKRKKPEKVEADIHIEGASKHLEVVITSLQLYKQGLMDGLESEVARVGAICTQIDNALAFVRESMRRG